jgi:hypothetical protein
MALFAALICALPVAVIGLSTWKYNPVWESLTKEPGTTQGGLATYQGGETSQTHITYRLAIHKRYALL